MRDSPIPIPGSAACMSYCSVTRDQPEGVQYDGAPPQERGECVLKFEPAPASQPDAAAGFPVRRDGKTSVHVVNSLTCAPGRRGTEKEQLFLMNKDLASWYACGPTVYDSAHIGHASSYVRFDIVRRILSKFFHTNIVMVMGITDIDDKIIWRAQETGAKDFRDISRHYETEFYEDMAQLNVLPATVYTRVSDHIPHIVAFIERIVQNGYGYPTSNGSVYFDVEAYTLPRYNKLASQDLDTGQDDDPSVADSEKRHPRDFALWKGVKPGEPWWDAPWGRGRPGWHIECSAMSCAIFGQRLDIHTGGRDLAFPHHNNEIAQCGACFNSEQWANYFLHTGHLHLKHDANKMSKSLKNVVSIWELLTDFSSSEFRVFCLMAKYNRDIEYAPDVMQQAVTIQRQISAFLNDADAYIRGHIACQPFDEADFMQQLAATRQQVIEAFADDFDTKRALDSILKLVHRANAHFSQPADERAARSPGLVAAMSSYISDIMTSLGVEFSTKSNVQTDQTTQVMTSALDTLVNFRQEVRHWALTIPEGDGTASASQSSSESVKQRRKRVMAERSPLLKACDNVRETLADSGVQIKDRGSSATWEFIETKKSPKAEDGER
ncbi:probable cysteine--tRNA ligase, mitochondrial [Diadema antillarum]|uniref:probable cysteine--tRNA ligase, mitochondrial n=1 Tax=Diadema antillarum TaxID=105358 RepID=UPI003A864B66